jgi:hypothetical protein
VLRSRQSDGSNNVKNSSSERCRTHEDEERICKEETSRRKYKILLAVAIRQAKQ